MESEVGSRSSCAVCPHLSCRPKTLQMHQGLLKALHITRLQLFKLWYQLAACVCSACRHTHAGCCAVHVLIAGDLVQVLQLDGTRRLGLGVDTPCSTEPCLVVQQQGRRWAGGRQVLALSVTIKRMAVMPWKLHHIQRSKEEKCPACLGLFRLLVQLPTHVLKFHLVSLINQSCSTSLFGMMTAF